MLWYVYQEFVIWGVFSHAIKHKPNLQVKVNTLFMNLAYVS